uniref:Endonuclease/exonuclease/phosphatase domain-containing protein n=2 Tax=Cacopsylla melanoneura TaxID=428564 RepID=A0A8D8VVM4_9HEMI
MYSTRYFCAQRQINKPSINTFPFKNNKCVIERRGFNKSLCSCVTLCSDIENLVYKDKYYQLLSFILSFDHSLSHYSDFISYPYSHDILLSICQCSVPVPDVPNRCIRYGYRLPILLFSGLQSTQYFYSTVFLILSFINKFHAQQVQGGIALDICHILSLTYRNENESVPSSSSLSFPNVSQLIPTAIPPAPFFFSRETEGNEGIVNNTDGNPTPTPFVIIPSTSTLSPLAPPFIPRNPSSSSRITDDNQTLGLDSGNHIPVGNSTIVPDLPNSILTILHQNIQGLNSDRKIPSIEAFLDTLQREHGLLPDVLCFTESWLRPDTYQCANIPGYTNIANYFRVVRTRGATGIFMKNNLDFISLDIDIPPIELNFEYCAITSPSLDIAIVCVYRSNNPSSCFETFFAQLDLLLQKLCCFKYLIVCGDFNINLQSNTNEKTRLVNILKMFNMKPTITTPTRVTTETSTCIDNILINFPIKNVLNKQNNNIFNGIGDHQYAQIISFHTKPLNEVKKIFTRTYDPTKIENFNQALSNTNFNHIYTVQTTDEKMSAFYSIFPVA